MRYHWGHAIGHIYSHMRVAPEVILQPQQSHGDSCQNTSDASPVGTGPSSNTLDNNDDYETGNDDDDRKSEHSLDGHGDSDNDLDDASEDGENDPNNWVSDDEFDFY